MSGGPARDFIEQLLPRAYRVVVQAADQVLVADVRVEVDRTVVLKVVRQGDRFALAR